MPSLLTPSVHPIPKRPMGALVCVPWPLPAGQQVVVRVALEACPLAHPTAPVDEPEPAAEPQEAPLPLGRYALPHIAVHVTEGVPPPLPEGWILLPRTKTRAPMLPKQPPPFLASGSDRRPSWPPLRHGFGAADGHDVEGANSTMSVTESALGGRGLRVPQRELTPKAAGADRSGEPGEEAATDDELDRRWDTDEEAGWILACPLGPANIAQVSENPCGVFPSIFISNFFLKRPFSGDLSHN